VSGVENERAKRFMRHDGLCGIVGGYGYCTCGMEEARDALTTPAQGLDAATIERCARIVADGYRCRSCGVVFVEDHRDVLNGGHPENGCDRHNWDKLGEDEQVEAIRALNTASTTTRGEDARLREALEWQSIESAPRDGTEFLALVSNGWYALVSAPAEALREGWPYQWWRSNDRQSYPVEDTHSADTDWGNRLRLTHWRHLPAAPALQRNDAHTSQEKGNE
jgi:hypothetical protein